MLLSSLCTLAHKAKIWRGNKEKSSHLVSFCPDVEQKWWKAADLMILRAYGSDLRVESLLTSIRTLLQLKCNKYVLNRENYGSHVFSGCGYLCLAKKNHKEPVNMSVNVLTLSISNWMLKFMSSSCSVCKLRPLCCPLHHWASSACGNSKIWLNSRCGSSALAPKLLFS